MNLRVQKIEILHIEVQYAETQVKNICNTLGKRASRETDHF